MPKVDELIYPSGWFAWAFGLGGLVGGSFGKDNDSDIRVRVCSLAGTSLGCCVALLGSCGGRCFSTESLILAQDERWRRA